MQLEDHPTVKRIGAKAQAPAPFLTQQSYARSHEIAVRTIPAPWRSPAPIARLRNSLIMDAVLRGGVADANNIPPALLKEMYLVGNRPGHYRGFLSLLRNAESWDTATKDYGRIQMPILLILGRPGLGAARP